MHDKHETGRFLKREDRTKKLCLKGQDIYTVSYSTGKYNNKIKLNKCSKRIV